MAAGGHFVQKFPQKYRPIQNWPPAAILSKNFKKKIAYLSEMARNGIEIYLRTSKMAASGHFVKNLKKRKKVPCGSEMARIAIESEFRKSKMADRSEMARNAIESEFRTSKMADVSHFVKNFKKNCVSIWNGQKCDRKFCQKFQQKKLRIDVKWIEMRSKVIFEHPKWPTAANLSKIVKNFNNKKSCISIWNGQKWDRKWFSDIHILKWRQPFYKQILKKIKSLYWYKITRNVTQSEFRTSKMADGSHFVKLFFLKLRIDLKWPEMPPKVIFGHPKWPLAVIL